MQLDQWLLSPAIRLFQPRLLQLLCCGVLAACGGGGGGGNNAAPPNNPPNNPPPSDPSVSISGASIVEGDAGSTTISATVTLSAAAGSDVSVDYSTADGSATAGSDYISVTGTLTIAAGNTSGTIDIDVRGDTVQEPDETLTATLANPTNATLGNATATLTITNDDTGTGTPTLSIDDNAVDEGDAGTTSIDVTVTLSASSTSDVTVDYATSDGSATAGSDYTATTGTLTIIAGDTSGTIAVDVLGDTDQEPDETLIVRLSNPSNADLAQATATLLINNDDTTAPIGLNSRPSNTSCLAPARTTTPGTIGLVDAFPNLPDLDFPMKLVQAPNDSNTWYAVLRQGGLQRFANTAGVNSSERYLTVSGVNASGEGGFLAAAHHPDWPTTKEIYVSYTSSAGGFHSRLSRLVITDDSSLPATYTEEILLTVDQPQTNHNGGDLAFGPDGNLYYSMGDGGGSNDPLDAGQNPTRLLGNILRIGVNGVAFPSPGYTIPAGNPFAAKRQVRTRHQRRGLPRDFCLGPAQSLAHELRSTERSTVRRRRGSRRPRRGQHRHRRQQLRLALPRGLHRRRHDRLPEQRLHRPHLRLRSLRPATARSPAASSIAAVT